jgi:hypothetical protein
MPALLNNPAHWHLRAQETRLLAAQLIDPEAKASILGMADEYDRLAVRAAKRLEEQTELKEANGRSLGTNPVEGCWPQEMPIRRTIV